MHPEIKVIYRSLCPVCGRDLTWKEIEEKKCFNKNISFGEFFRGGKFEEFSKYFREKTGFALKSVQKFWAKKLLKGLSFTAVAPTGTGKTLFGLVYALFLAERGRKSYIIVPTTLLLKQSYQKLSGMSQKIRILCYLPGMKKAQKEEFFEKLDGYIKHMHVHNNYGIWDEHNPLNGGLIDFSRLKLKTDVAMLEVRNGSRKDIFRSLANIR